MAHLLTSIGVALVDFLPIEERGATTGFSMHPGGEMFNVAVGLARLGQASAFAGKLADDFFGRYLREHMLAQGVDPRFVAVDPQAPTTLAFVAKQAGEPAFTFYGDAAADTLLVLGELPEDLFSETRLLHFGGIGLLRGSTAGTVIAAAERLKGQALLSFDPNIRPSLVADEPGYRATLDRLFGLADIVKVSQADLAWLAPGRPVEAVASEILAGGPGLVVVTRGGEGALAVRAATRTALVVEAATPASGVAVTHVPNFPVAVVDTVGAGDAFSSGLLAALTARDVVSRAALANLAAADLEQALRFAAATAALTCSRAGANPPLLDEVERFLQERI